MASYEIFGGRFGHNVTCAGVMEFDTVEEALDVAYEHACKVYDDSPYRTVEEIMEEEDASKDEALELYEEERDEYLDYYVNNLDEEVEEDDDTNYEEEWEDSDEWIDEEDED